VHRIVDADVARQDRRAVLQVHAVDAEDDVVIQRVRRLRRRCTRCHDRRDDRQQRRE
jgi:hypothetical protein